MCCGPDELLPEDAHVKGKYRPVRNALRPARGKRKCAACPKHDAKKAWCPVLAKVASGLEPMCRYGAAELDRMKRSGQ